MTDARTPEGRRCPDGHAVLDESRFCPDCGRAISTEVDDLRHPVSQTYQVSRPLLVAAAAALVLVVLVALVASWRDDEEANENTSRETIGTQATSTAPSPEQQCETDMSAVLYGLIDDSAAGYSNLTGPAARDAANTYGIGSPFYYEAFQAMAQYGYPTLMQSGQDAAYETVPDAASLACSNLIQSEAPVVSGDPSEGLPEAAPDESASGCNAGVSGCMFYNEIQAEALFADIASAFSVSATDVGCDLSDVRFDNVAVGETFYCSTDSSGYPTVAVLVTDSAPFYSISAAPSSGD